MSPILGRVPTVHEIACVGLEWTMVFKFYSLSRGQKLELLRVEFLIVTFRHLCLIMSV